MKKPSPKPKAAPAAAEGEGRARRERKTVQHFQVAAPKKDDAPVAFEGKGTKLRDIPNGETRRRPARASPPKHCTPTDRPPAPLPRSRLQDVQDHRP